MTITSVTITIGWLVLFGLSIILHEVAHGWVAWKLGDPTAKQEGRLTLSPVSHIDPMFSILMPVICYISSGGTMLFGGARPVPVNPFNLRNPRRDMVWISAAGPGTNLLLALVCVLFLRMEFLLRPGSVGQVIFFRALQTNILLACFNLIPIPPLDGSRILRGLLPREQAGFFDSIEPYGLFILIALLATGMLGVILGPMINAVMRVFLLLL